MTVREFEFFARCASGFEAVLAQELKTLRLCRVRPLKGGVAFFGALEDAYRACLWTRVATRVQVVLCRVPAHDAQALYRGVASFPWECHIRSGATISVDAHGDNPKLRNTKFTALKVKDALCDRMRETTGSRPNVDARDADFAVDVALHQEKATVYLNLSGASLHRRGYREDGVQTEAPLKETLAAGVLLAAGWPALAQAGGALVDPMCGSGTLAIEGALMAADIAPGLLRRRWGFEGWRLHDRGAWDKVVAAANERCAWDGCESLVIAGDLDGQAVEVARANARRAGVDRIVRFYVDDAANLKKHLRALHGRADVPGLLAANPPYGRRLLSAAELPEVNATLAQAVSALPPAWEVALITPDMTVDTALGRVPKTTIACYNGPIQTYVRVYDADEGLRVTHEVVSLTGRQRTVPLADEKSVQFAARLRKVAKERMRWARKEAIGCYRLYDADLPDYAFSLDYYLGTGADAGKTYAVLEEYRRPASVDSLVAARRLADATALAAATLDMAARDVVARPWQDGERSSVRAPIDAHARGGSLLVEERGLSFEIDLNGRPDSGLVLGLRDVRALVGEKAKGKRFLDLFGSAGAMAVYAAVGGATETVSVEPFPDRAETARQTLRTNGFMGKRYRVEHEDARVWLKRAIARRRTFDLVLCAPPSWMSAYGAASLGQWSLQRDHVELVKDTAQLLSAGGALVLCTADRSFKLDQHALERTGLAVEDISAQMLPRDFVRARTPHRCFCITT